MISRIVQQPHTKSVSKQYSDIVSQDAIDRYISACLLESCQEIQKVARQNVKRIVWWRANTSQVSRIQRAIKYEIESNAKIANVYLKEKFLRKDDATRALLFGTEDTRPDGWDIRPRNKDWLRWNPIEHIKTGAPYRTNDIFAKESHHPAFKYRPIKFIDYARNKTSVRAIFKKNKKKLLDGVYDK